MARRTARPRPTRDLELPALTRTCPGCGAAMWAAYKTYRTVTTLDGLVRLGLQVRRCRDRGCPRFGIPLRPEGEGRLVLPQHEFGLDVVATVGRLRHAEHRSIPEIHAELARRGVPICVRSVGNLLDRYDELLALSPPTPDDCGGSPPRPARSCWPSTACNPTSATRSSGSCATASAARSCWPEASCPRPRTTWPVCFARSRRRCRCRSPAWSPTARTRSARRSKPALDGVPHQLCQFHYLREAAKPVYEADRHAKVQLKKKVRGIRPIERKVEGREDDEAGAIRGYCAAVRSALTDDGRPPLAASGLKLHGRLAAVAASLDRVGAKRGSRGS